MGISLRNGVDEMGISSENFQFFGSEIYNIFE